MMPFVAQSAAMAIEDAVCLARMLDGQDLAGAPAALKGYEMARTRGANRLATWSPRFDQFNFRAAQHGDPISIFAGNRAFAS
jgi:2-polyprenyl-6-methoxyphenol hydroxylase-like FAD-dependent oxidoreductase